MIENPKYISIASPFFPFDLQYVSVNKAIPIALPINPIIPSERKRAFSDSIYFPSDDDKLHRPGKNYSKTHY
jgi:hypothetical protein